MCRPVTCFKYRVWFKNSKNMSWDPTGKHELPGCEMDTYLQLGHSRTLCCQYASIRRTTRWVLEVDHEDPVWIHIGATTALQASISALESLTSMHTHLVSRDVWCNIPITNTIQQFVTNVTWSKQAACLTLIAGALLGVISQAATGSAPGGCTVLTCSCCCTACWLDSGVLGQSCGSCSLVWCLSKSQTLIVYIQPPLHKDNSAEYTLMLSSSPQLCQQRFVKTQVCVDMWTPRVCLPCIRPSYTHASLSESTDVACKSITAGLNSMLTPCQDSTGLVHAIQHKSRYRCTLQAHRFACQARSTAWRDTCMLKLLLGWHFFDRHICMSCCIGLHDAHIC